MKGLASGLAIALLAPLAAVAPAAAEPWVLDIDAGASTVRFELGATLHTVRGSATIEEGGPLRFDPETGEASGEVVVDATSADTGNGSRDEKMHREVLESAEHPRIVFTARSIEVSSRSDDAGSFVLRGDLAIHGGVHEVALEGRATGSLPGAVEARAEGVLPYVEWGMKDVSTFLLSVDEEVRVVLEVKGESRPAGAPASGG